MTNINQQIVDYTSTMKGYYIALYYQDVKILNSFFNVKTEVIPQSTLMSYELKELRVLQVNTSKIVRQKAFDTLKALRDTAYQFNKQARLQVRM